MMMLKRTHCGGWGVDHGDLAEDHEWTQETHFFNRHMNHDEVHPAIMAEDAHQHVAWTITTRWSRVLASLDSRVITPA